MFLIDVAAFFDHELASIPVRKKLLGQASRSTAGSSEIPLRSIVTASRVESKQKRLERE